MDGGKNKIDYFIERTDHRFDRMESKIDKLITFRAMLYGGSAVVSALVAAAMIIIFGK